MRCPSPQLLSRAEVLRTCSDAAPNFIALSGNTLIYSESHLNVAMFDYCQTFFVAFESKTVRLWRWGAEEAYESV